MLLGTFAGEVVPWNDDRIRFGSLFEVRIIGADDGLLQYGVDGRGQQGLNVVPHRVEQTAALGTHVS